MKIQKCRTRGGVPLRAVSALSFILIHLSVPVNDKFFFKSPHKSPPAYCTPVYMML